MKPRKILTSLELPFDGVQHILHIATITVAVLLVFSACAETGAGAPGNSYPHGDGVTASSSAVVRWATAVVENSYQPGPEASMYTNPEQALGPASSVSTAVVVLGRGGSIVMDMNTPFGNGDGADFAVWENGIAGSDGTLFAELAFVEVSSDGTSFARFPTITTRKTAVGAYEPIDPGEYSGFAGLHPGGTGTAFDLSELIEVSEVMNGQVDLRAIRYIRVVDVVGDGTVTDSEGNAVFDPYPTTGTAGFDLNAVGVLKN